MITLVILIPIFLLSFCSLPQYLHLVCTHCHFETIFTFSLKFLYLNLLPKNTFITIFFVFFLYFNSCFCDAAYIISNFSKHFVQSDNWICICVYNKNVIYFSLYRWMISCMFVGEPCACSIRCHLKRARNSPEISVMAASYHVGFEAWTQIRRKCYRCV